MYDDFIGRKEILRRVYMLCMTAMASGRRDSNSTQLIEANWGIQRL